MWLQKTDSGAGGISPETGPPTPSSMYSLVAKKLIPLYEFLYEFLLGGV